MQNSDFERALHERVEFAVFVAYEQWVQAAGYDSFNPYDLLARLLPGLPDALSRAVEARGGWAMLDPVSGLPATGAQLLVAQVVSHVVDQLVGAAAQHVHGQAVLAEQLAHAVGRAVNGFVGDPESWRLATIASPPGASAARADTATDAIPAPAGPAVPAPAPAGLSAAPAAAAAADAAGQSGSAASGAPASAINEIETWLHSFLASPGGAGGIVDASVGLRVASIGSFQAVADSMAVSPAVPAPALSGLFYDIAGDGLDTPIAVGDSIGDPLAGDPGGHGDLFHFPSSLELAITHWIHLGRTATFFRAEAGGMVALSRQEAFEIVGRIVDTLVQNAELQMNHAAGSTGWGAQADLLLAEAEAEATQQAAAAAAAAQAVGETASNHAAGSGQSDPHKHGTHDQPLG